MKHCQLCDCNDEEVLEVHHIDGNRHNNSPENLFIVCANCHLKVHHRNFRNKPDSFKKDLSIKSELFDDKRLYELKQQMRERDYKVNQWLKEKGLA